MQQIQKRSKPQRDCSFFNKVYVLCANRISPIMPYLPANQTELQCGLQPEVQLLEH